MVVEAYQQGQRNFGENYQRRISRLEPIRGRVGAGLEPCIYSVELTCESMGD
uniref:Uncharacterized protein n=1 Tax=Anguilla anguilla TaxID=7936 RepID=A0A0E9W7P9_ANGAN